MQLSQSTLSYLAEFICGSSGGGQFQWDNFPYRSSSYLTQFFRECDLDFTHQSGTRKYWVESVLEELNKYPGSHPSLPSDALITVIRHLLDPMHFERGNLDCDAALVQVNKALQRDGLQVYLDGAGGRHVRSIGTTTTTATLAIQPRAWTPAELRLRRELDKFLTTASEDDFTEKFLVPLFRQLGFVRVTAAGHKDKALEYGKDLWMKFRLPTGHWIYFGSQVKKDKIDAAGSKLTTNIASILTQVDMMLMDPIFDPETNQHHLLDHVFVISSGGITKAAKNLMGRHLDQHKRRHIIFFERDELLDLAVQTNLPWEDSSTPPQEDTVF